MSLRAAAPVDPAALDLVLQPHERALTLPPEAYASQDVFDWEIEILFEGSWMCVGRVRDLALASAGDQVGVQAGRQSFVLVRGDDGQLRSFHNICRHRGHELLAVGESRHQRGIRCPYHAWVYGLEGDCRAAPRFDMPEFDKGAFGLVEARVAEWDGWLFVNARGDAPAFEEQVGNLALVVDDYSPATLRLGARHEYELAANWKIAIENYLECYHCSEIHPELCKVTPPESDISYSELPSGSWIGGPMELRDHADTMSLTGESRGTVIPSLPEDMRRIVGYAALFPNLLISPHPDYVMTHRLVPLAPGRTWIECAWYFPEEAFEKPGFTPDYASEFWDITNREDWIACESVQRNVTSPGYRQGPFSHWEVDVFRAQAMIARSYLAGRLVGPDHDLVSHSGDSPAKR